MAFWRFWFISFPFTALLFSMVHGSPLNAPVITLGEKKSLFGEKAQTNEYVSYALYYWPDPANP